MMEKLYTYALTFTGGMESGRWRILKRGASGHFDFMGADVWSMPWKEEHEGTGEPPLELRTEYERLLRESGWQQWAEPEHLNLVEMIADDDECAYDQPCAHGYRVETHAVYCHNKKWLYAPSKCRRHGGGSVWGDEPWPHDQCPGYLANPLTDTQIENPADVSADGHSSLG
jgi:hypothetical protein